MSTDFEKVLVHDDCLNCTDEIKHQVTKGGQNVVSQSYSAIPQSISGTVFNCVIPSLETIVSREVLWTSTVVLEVYLTEARNLASAAPSAQTHGITDQMFFGKLWGRFSPRSISSPFPL